jgi:hypothetical protein
MAMRLMAIGNLLRLMDDSCCAFGGCDRDTSDPVRRSDEYME